MDTASVFHSILLFVLAGICEIGGGWLIWRWPREGRPSWWGLAGGVILILYGIIPTLRTTLFGQVYAVYCGFFIVLAILWGWYFDGDRPDRADVIGATIALIGVGVMICSPRMWFRARFRNSSSSHVTQWQRMFITRRNSLWEPQRNYSSAHRLSSNSSSAASSTGLTTWKWKPASFERRLSSSCPHPVTATRVMSRPHTCCRIRRATS